MSRRFTYYGSYASTPAYDADAQAYFDKQDTLGSTTTAFKEKVNTLIVGLKANSLWTKFNGKYLYFLDAGAADTTRLNAINPLYTDAAFQIDWNGGMSFNTVGATGDGTGYGNNHFIPSSHNSLNDSCNFIYSNTNNGAASMSDYGTFNAGTLGTLLHIKFVDNNTYWSQNDSGTAGASNVVTDTSGLFLVNKDNATTRTLDRNGTEIKLAVGGADQLSVNEMVLCARNAAGTIQLYSTRQYRIFGCCTSLTTAERTIMDNLIEAYMTA